MNTIDLNNNLNNNLSTKNNTALNNVVTAKKDTLQELKNIQAQMNESISSEIVKDKINIKEFVNNIKNANSKLEQIQYAENNLQVKINNLEKMQKEIEIDSSKLNDDMSANDNQQYIKSQTLDSIYKEDNFKRDDANEATALEDYDIEIKQEDIALMQKELNTKLQELQAQSKKLEKEILSSYATIQEMDIQEQLSAIENMSQKDVFSTPSEDEFLNTTKSLLDPLHS